MGKMCVAVLNLKLCIRSEKNKENLSGTIYKNKLKVKETHLHACEGGREEKGRQEEVECVGWNIHSKLGEIEWHVLAAF